MKKLFSLLLALSLLCAAALPAPAEENDRAASLRASFLGGDVVLRREEHGEHLRRVFLFFRNAAEDIDHPVQRGHSDGVPQLRLTVQVAEDLEPLQVVRKVVVIHRDDGNARRFRRRGDGLVTAHGGRADDQVGLERNDILGAPVFPRGRLRQHRHAFILRHVAADIKVVQLHGGASADHARRRAARLIPQGDEAAVEHCDL